MIDFEGLASERARTLSQPKEAWLNTIRQPYFEIACSTLSDGEIMQLFSITESPSALAALAEAFAEASQSGESMAFEKWKNALSINNISLQQAARLWERAWGKEKKFTKCLDLITSSADLPKRKRV